MDAASGTRVASTSDTAGATPQVPRPAPEPPKLGAGPVSGPARLIEGWEGLKPGMKAEDLAKLRPAAKGSDLTSLVWTEPLAHPWLAASYRFGRGGGELIEVRWLVAEDVTGPKPFAELKARGMSRWRVRARSEDMGSERTTRWALPYGEMRLQLEVESGKLRFEWTPTRPPPEGSRTSHGAASPPGAKGP